MENYKYELNLYSSFSIDQKIMNNIYLPILGKDAIFLYQYLVTECNENKNSLFLNNNHKKLFNCNNLDWDKFVELRKRLEAIGLITTYINKENQTFTYVLKSPLNFEDFCNDSKLYSILKNRLSSKELNELKYIFSPFLQSANMFEISETIDYLLTETDHKDLFIFNFDKLYEKLINEFQMNFELNYEIKKQIDDLFNNRDLNFNEIYELLKNCVVDTTNGYCVSITAFNERLKVLKDEKAESELAKKIIINRNFDIFNSNKDLSEFSLIINDYKKYKTENYITSILKENIDLEMKSWLNILRIQYHFNDEIINPIVDYVIFKNNGALHKNYILKIAKSILAKAINNVEDAIIYLRNTLVKKELNLNYLVEPKKEININTKIDLDNLSESQKKVMSFWR